MPKPKEIQPVSRDVMERVARILGPSSAAAQALADLDHRLASGQNVAIYEIGSSYFVGPAPATTETLAATVG
jgi:hypothetical protein